MIYPVTNYLAHSFSAGRIAYPDSSPTAAHSSIAGWEEAGILNHSLLLDNILTEVPAITISLYIPLTKP